MSQATTFASRARGPLGCLVGALAALGCTPDPGFVRDAARPNVLIVTLDTTRPDRLGCYGHSVATSPELDRLCADAVVYERAYSTSSWTLPAHASLFTGLHTHAHGATNDAQGPLLLEEVLPERAAQGHRVRGLSRSLPTLAGIASDAGYATAGFVAGPWMKRVFGLDEGFAHWDDSDIDALNGRRAEGLTDAALAWLGRGHDQPFLLFLNYYDPHSPFDPPEDWRPEGAPAPGRVPDLAQALALYDAEIRYMDHHLGRVLDALRRFDLYEDAWILVTADHGEVLGEHRITGHGRFLYEEEIRIPFVLKAPGRPAGRSEVPVQLTDVARLLLPVLGREVPVAAAAVRPLVAELLPAPEFAGRGDWRTLVEWPYKLIWNSREKHRLHDLRRKRAEDMNLFAGDPERGQAMLARLEAYLDALPEPPRDDTAPALLDDETRRALESLGYLEGDETP